MLKASVAAIRHIVRGRTVNSFAFQSSARARPVRIDENLFRQTPAEFVGSGKSCGVRRRRCQQFGPGIYIGDLLDQLTVRGSPEKVCAFNPASQFRFQREPVKQERSRDAGPPTEPDPKPALRKSKPATAKRQDGARKSLGRRV